MIVKLRRTRTSAGNLIFVKKKKRFKKGLI